jgi:hypothetical protein
MIREAKLHSLAQVDQADPPVTSGWTHGRALPQLTCLVLPGLDSGVAGALLRSMSRREWGSAPFRRRHHRSMAAGQRVDTAGGRTRGNGCALTLSIEGGHATRAVPGDIQAAAHFSGTPGLLAWETDGTPTPRSGLVGILAWRKDWASISPSRCSEARQRPIPRFPPEGRKIRSPVDLHQMAPHRASHPTGANDS